MRTGLWGFWALNLASLAAIVGFTSKEFQTGRDFTQYEVQDLIATDTLTISLADNPYGEDWGILMDDLQISGKSLVSNDVFIHVRKSESEHFEMEQKSSSRGVNSKEARQLAETVDYQINLQGSNLILPPNFLIPKGSKWRNQKIHLYIRVPEGKYIVFENDADRKIRSMDINDDYDHPWRYHSDGYLWKMESEGLICPEYIEDLQEEFDFEEFSKIHIEGEIEVNITQGDDFEVALTDKCNCSKYIEIVQFGDRLDISSSRHIHNAKLNITLPSLEVLDLKHTLDINVRGFEEESMDIWIENTHKRKTKAYLEVGELTIKQKGNHKLEIIGEGKILKASLDHYSDLDAERYEVDVADITAKGANEIDLLVNDTLRQNIDPNVELNVEGEPVIVSGTEVETAPEPEVQQEIH